MGVSLPKDSSYGIKGSVSIFQGEGLIFSYDLEPYYYHKRITINVFQKETGFSVFAELTDKPDGLYVTRCTLTKDPRLGNLNQILYNAAVIELVFKALELIVNYASQKATREIFLGNEAASVFYEKRLLPNMRTEIRDEEEFLIVPATKKDCCVLSNNIAHAMEIICREIDKLQKTDKYLAAFLQKDHLMLDKNDRLINGFFSLEYH